MELSIWAGAELSTGRVALTRCSVDDVWNFKGANMREELKTTGLQSWLEVLALLSTHGWTLVFRVRRLCSLLCMSSWFSLIRRKNPGGLAHTLALLSTYGKIRALRWYLS